MNKKNKSFVLGLTQIHRHIKGRISSGCLKEDAKTTVVVLYVGNYRKLQKTVYRFFISIRDPFFRNRASLPIMKQQETGYFFFL
jgi:hypothetical protein